MKKNTCTTCGKNVNKCNDRYTMTCYDTDGNVTEVKKGVRAVWDTEGLMLDPKNVEKNTKEGLITKVIDSI